MKTQEVRDLSVEQVRERLEESREAFFQLRMQFATGQLKNTAQLRRARRDIARLETILQEKVTGQPAGEKSE